MNRLPLRDRLQAALDMVNDCRRAGHSTTGIISRLQVDHDASYRQGPSTNTLRVAGVTASCTWSATDGLLKGWTKNATMRLLQLDGRTA